MDDIDKKKDSPLKESVVADASPSQSGTYRRITLARAFKLDLLYDRGISLVLDHCESALTAADLCRIDLVPSVKQPPDVVDKDVKPSVTNAEATQPLAPPPRPSQQNPTDTPDYFSASHGTQYSLEPNLFEQSFGQPSAETPGKSILPPVASLTSPGNANLGSSFNWSGSLRSGPLSPAMLSGPAGTGDYFDSIRGSFPTPNESSLRTGLTPGGGGSMFPAPSPGSQAFLNSLASGGATPSTLDFHRTAANAAAVRKAEQTQNNPSTTQAPAARTQTAAMDPTAQQQTSQSNFGQHDNDAANGLFMLAQATNESQSSNQFAAANQPAPNAPQDTKRSTRNNAGSIGGSISTGSVLEANGESEPEQPKSGTKKSKKSSGKGGNSRRKADDAPAKQPASKKSKANNGSVHDMSDGDSDEDPSKEELYHENGKKMTDEEKRKNFLERNR